MGPRGKSIVVGIKGLNLLLKITGSTLLTSLLINFHFSEACWLEYAIVLTKVTEPMEERMEQALFSPPLSKQRVEFAVRHIIDSSSATLVGMNFLPCILFG